MKLKDLLSDRLAINMLKVMYDNEQKKNFSIRLSEMKLKIQQSTKFLSSKGYGSSINALSSFRLIGIEANNHDKTMTLTEKGKDFFEAFDKMKNTLLSEKPLKRKIKVIFDLTKAEKKVLLAIQKLCKQSSTQFIPMQLVAKEYGGKVANVSRILNHLAALDFVASESNDGLELIGLTPKGKETLKEQILSTIF